MQKYEFPFITLEQAVAYEPSKPETKTESPLLNAVIECIYSIYPKHQSKVASILGVDPSNLNGALKCIVGVTYSDLLTQWRLKMYMKIKKEEPSIKADDLARRLGFYNHTSLWFFLEREHQYIKKRCSKAEIKRSCERMQEEFLAMMAKYKD